MVVPITEKEETIIEALAAEAELLLEESKRKDLKEKRGFIKQTFYGGSQKIKHLLPKGKHL